MKAYINKDLKVIVMGVATNLTLNEDLFYKMSLQTNKTFLIINNGEYIFNRSFEQVINELRKIRDEELKKTDYLFFSDNSYLTTTVEKTELKAKRKSLRDITEGLTTVEQILIKIKSIV